MKKIFIITLLIVSFWSVASTVVMAANPLGDLVTCGRTVPGSVPQKDSVDSEGHKVWAAQSCDFKALIDMINRIIRYLIYISIPLAAISFAYAGWIYMSAGGDTGKVKKAHDIFLSVGIGFILVLSAWLIFNLIANTFLDPNAGYSTYLK